MVLLSAEVPIGQVLDQPREERRAQEKHKCRN